MNDYVTLEEFGAIGDGITNDRDAFIKATESNKNILLLDKTYMISGKTIFHNARIFGSNNSCIKFNTGSIYFLDNTIIKNINITSSYRQIGFSSSTEPGGNILIDNCSFSNTYTHFYNPSTVIIKNSDFDTDDVSSLSENALKYEYIHIANAQFPCCEKILIDNCIFKNSPTDAFDLYPNGNHLNMTNCKFIDCKSVSEIKCGNDTLVERKDIKFDNIYVELKQNANGIRCYNQSDVDKKLVPSVIFNNIVALYKFDTDELKHSGSLIKCENTHIIVNNVNVINNEDFTGYTIGASNSTVQLNNINSKSSYLVNGVNSTIHISNSIGRNVRGYKLFINNCDIAGFYNNDYQNFCCNISNSNIKDKVFFMGGNVLMSNVTMASIRNKCKYENGLCVVSNSITHNIGIPEDNENFKSINLVYIEE